MDAIRSFNPTGAGQLTFVGVAINLTQGLNQGMPAWGGNSAPALMPPCPCSNPGGFGSLFSSAGRNGSGRRAGYIRGLEDALKQVRGKRSKPDENRIRALLQSARQEQSASGGSFESRPAGHCHRSQARNPFGPTPAMFGGGSGARGGSAEAEWSQGYTQGLEAALGQIRGKQSKPDEERVRSLLQGAKQSREALFGWQNDRGNGFAPVRPALCAPPLFSGNLF